MAYKHLKPVRFGGPGGQSRDDAVAQITTALETMGVDPSSGEFVDTEEDGKTRVQWMAPEAKEAHEQKSREQLEREAYNEARDAWRRGGKKGDAPTPPGV